MPETRNACCQILPDRVAIKGKRDTAETWAMAEFAFPDWEEDAYIFLPGCVYNGNRQPRVVRGYPPMYRPEECGVDCPPLMTDVPALNPDGSGMIQVTSGDLATPCVGVFFRKKQEGFLLFTEQQVKGKNIGFQVSAGKIQIQLPAHRTDLYRFCQPHRTDGDGGIPIGTGECLESRIRRITFSCPDIPSFFRRFFAERKCLLSSPRARFGYNDSLWELMEHHFNTAAWSGEYYAEISKKWQAGWVGGGMSSYALLKKGSPLSRERAVKTVDYLVAHQAPSGFYYGICLPDGTVSDDSFGTPGMEHLHLVRKSADALYFLWKHCTVPKFSAPQAWVDSAKRCVDALVRLWERYGTFGQFVNDQTGEKVVGTGASAAMAPAALTGAYRMSGDDRYLIAAERGLRFYLDRFLRNGICQCAEQARRPRDLYTFR